MNYRNNEYYKKSVQNKLDDKNIQYCKTYSRFSGRARFIIDIGNNKCVYLYYDSYGYNPNVDLFAGAIIRNYSFDEACDMALNDCIKHRIYNNINIHNGNIAKLSEGPKDDMGHPTWTIRGILDRSIDINGNEL